MASADTTPAATAAQEAAWRSMSGAERVRLALEMSDDLMAVSLAGLARRRPDLSSERRVRELILLMHGIDVSAPAPSG